ncbi:MAG TPA: pyridoxal-dependent decarboxylase [Bryobacteraceae bacterium]|nr:pyridoxal-dependent decarboxylase [Bryobacteraceae bacterium]
MASGDLRFDKKTREELWRVTAAEIERYFSHVDEGRVTPELVPEKVRAAVEACDFRSRMNPADAVQFLASGLSRYQTHTPHRRYFGLFNPSPASMGVAADALVAAFNPQLAAWSHSPLAIEIEAHLIRCFGEKFGYLRGGVDGTFTSGGAEANHTAVLTALTSVFPRFSSEGARALAGAPVMYCSSESHHSFQKAAMLCGLGRGAVRLIGTDSRYRIDTASLARAITADRKAGHQPFLAVATVGTTNAGVIDPLREVADIAARERIWFHADAAWGGAAALAPEMRGLLDGIELADSITFDAHKWLSVPMGAGLFLTRHGDILDRTFRVETAYMPREAKGLDVVDPHLHSMQWSRRFIGAKVFLALLAAGWEGYAAAVRHQAAMGRLLRRRLHENGWRVHNQTELPICCFTDPDGAGPHEIAMHVVASGEAWISTTVLGGLTALRACITNFATQESDIEALIVSLDAAREQVRRLAG